MRTRTEKTQQSEEEIFEEVAADTGLETLSDLELEEIVFEEEEQKPDGPFNLPTIAGLSMIVVGIVYLLQLLNFFSSFSLGAIVPLLPWLAGILIILVGFGVLSRRPTKKRERISRATRRRRKARRMDHINKPAEASQDAGDTTPRRARNKEKRRLYKSRIKKIAGVCGGLAVFFGLDPTLVRIAFCLGTILTYVIGPVFPIGYLVLALVMSPPQDNKSATKGSGSRNESIRIIKDQ